jgi:uncharacterized membrane protein YeiH
MEAEKLDVVGVVVLGTMTALGGGITRDILIGELPPASFGDWRYLAVATLSSLVAFVSVRLLTKALRLINVFDAAGLSLFCVTGTTAALAAGLGPFQATLLGAITAVGGGTIRDVVVRRVPTVLTSGLYAVPALVGAALTAAAFSADFYTGTVAVGAAITCFVIRLVGVRYDLHLPRSDPGGDRRRGD